MSAVATENMLSNTIKADMVLINRFLDNPTSLDPKVIIIKKYANVIHKPTHTFLVPKLVTKIDGDDFYEIPLPFAKNYLVSKDGQVAKVIVKNQQENSYHLLKKNRLTGNITISLVQDGRIEHYTRNRLIMITFENIKHAEQWYASRINTNIDYNDIRNLIWKKYSRYH